MSGIVGVCFLDGRCVAPADLDQMVKSLAHRGSDGSGIWSAGPAGLGHCMLWTTPESLHEQLPLVSANGNFILTADARIDNRDELIASLSLSDRPVNEISDSELIIHAYERWGDDCPQKLVGAYAFAIWDQQRQRLFCARDHIGFKPFYYHHSPNLFVFASEIKALFRLPEVPRRLNEVRVADHLTGFFEDPTITFYQGIYRLPPANYITIGLDGEVHLQTYWSLDPHREIRLGSDEAYAEAFREIFTEAVHCRLRSAHPVGFALSGGLDSSSIACTARRISTGGDNQPLHTFSAIFPGLAEEDLHRIDERHYIKAVLASGGFEPHYVYADRISPFVDLDRIFWHMDEVPFAPNLSMHWGLLQAAQQQGMRVFLDGIDGDETVSHGWEYLADLTRSGRWRTLLVEAKASSQRLGDSGQPRKIIWQHGVKPLIPESIINLRRVLRGDKHPAWAFSNAIDPDFARRIGLKKRVQDLLPGGSNLVRTAREKHWEALNSATIPLALEWLDKISAAFSLQMRFPFFDRRLMEFCLALPPEQKLSQGWPRVILRRAMADILPEDIRWRYTKANFNPSILHGLLNHEQGTLERVVHSELQIIEPYVNIPEVRAAYHRFSSQRSHRMIDSQTVYSAVILALWLQRANLIAD